MGVIANFGIRFGVDTSDVEAGTARLKTAVGGIGANLATVGAAIASSIDFSAVSAAAQKAVDTASRIADMAQRVGITAEAVQRLQFAAEQSGGSFEAVATAMRVMSDRIVDGKLPQALDDMGLSLLQLSGMSMDEAFLTVADAVGNIEDPMLRSATAVDIFGRGAQALMPAIVNGFRDVAEIAPVMSNELVGAADDVGDKWAELQLRMENLKAEALIPLVDLMLQMPVSAQIMGSAFTELLPFVSNFGIAAAMLPTAFENLISLAPGLSVVGAALASMAGPLALLAGAVVGVQALANALREFGGAAAEAQLQASGYLDDQNLGKFLQQKGYAPKPMQGPRLDPSVVMGPGISGLDQSTIGGAGIGNLLDPKRTQAAARATNEAAEAMKRLNREAFALESWARNEQGMSQFNADAAAMKKTADVLRAATFGMPQTGGMRSQDASALQSASNNIGAAMLAIPAQLQSQGASQYVAVGKTFGQQMMGGMNESFLQLPNVILKAFQGGGNVGASIGSFLGGSLGQSLASSLPKTLTNAFGGLLGQIIPGLGSLIGPLLTKMIGKLWSGIQGMFGTDEEAKDVNPARDQFLGQFGGAGTGVDSGFGKLAAQLTAITGEAGGGSLFQALMSADTMAEFNSAMAAINETLAGTTTGIQTTTESTDGLNIALQGSDAALAALGATQERVVATMLAGFDALIVKLGEFVAAMGAVGAASMPAVGAGEGGGIAPWTGDPNSPWGTGNWESDLPPEFPSFANEGMVSSPTLAMLHGTPNDPEFILRKSTLEGMAGGGSGGGGNSYHFHGTFIGTEQWFRDNAPRMMEAIQANANKSFSMFQSLQKQALGPTALVPGLP